MNSEYSYLFIYEMVRHRKDGSIYIEKCLKIGGTDKIEARKSSYGSHLPNPTLLAIIMESEDSLHIKFSKYRLHDEYFLYVDEILDYFKVNRELIERVSTFEYIQESGFEDVKINYKYCDYGTYRSNAVFYNYVEITDKLLTITPVKAKSTNKLSDFLTINGVSDSFQLEQLAKNNQEKLMLGDWYSVIRILDDISPTYSNDGWKKFVPSSMFRKGEPNYEALFPVYNHPGAWNSYCNWKAANSL